MEVSAKTGKKINELFDIILDTIIKSQKDDFLEPNTTRTKIAPEDTEPEPKSQNKTKLKVDIPSLR